MKTFTSKLLLRSLLAKAVQKNEAQPNQSRTILDNAIGVFQQLTDLGSATFNILDLSTAGAIGIQIVEISKVIPVFDERNRLMDHKGRKHKQIGLNMSTS